MFSLNILIFYLILIFTQKTYQFNEEEKFEGRSQTQWNYTSTYEEKDDPLEDLPKDLFTEEQRKNGAVLLHILAVVYFFTLLAVLCNDYFLPAVECICNDLRIPKHVAAATFMATATTMPEFFTNTISTLITESDMGIGTIIGSLMFNTLGVAALSGIAITKSIQLDWWPVTRDCIFYSFNIIVLIIITWKGTVTFVESLIMVNLCIVYYTIMFMQNKVMRYIRVLIEDKLNCCFSSRYDLTQPPEKSAKAKLPFEKSTGSRKEDLVIREITVSNVSGSTILKTSNVSEVLKSKNVGSFKEKVCEQFKKLTTIPNNTSAKIWFFYSWPIKAILTCIIPSPKAHDKLYPISFVMCIAFIGMNSYMVVWMLTVVGHTMRIPDSVMGMTFLAAGGATPEAFSSVISVRKGENGIGVSNALGANSLAILLSLSFPWLIKNALNYNDKDGNNVIHISSPGIEYTIGILLLSTISLFVVMSIAGFRLRKTVGIILLIIYAVYITMQILIEINIFFPEKHDA